MVLTAALVPDLIRAPSAPAQLPPPGAADTWLFAEGTTLPAFYEFLVAINPNPFPITVSVAYQLEEPAGVPQPGKTGSFSIPAGQRFTIPVYEAGPVSVGRGFTGVSALMTSADNFVAERVLYFIQNFDVGEVNGAHDALGVNSTSTTWYFAEGSTLQTPAPGVVTPQPGQADQLRGFLPYFTMQNPGSDPASVVITYSTNNPDSTVERTITVPAGARVTTDIANAYANPAYPGGLGPGFEGFGTRINSSQPIVVERPFYINRDFGAEIGVVNGATDERGAVDSNQTTRLFAEGTVLAGFSEFLTLFNPNASASDLTITYFVENSSSPVTRSLSLPALSRRTIQVFSDSDPAGLGRAAANASAPGSAGVSVRIDSTNGVGFVGERPMYFTHDFGNGVVNGAHDVLGASQPDTSWFFAEGTLRPGFFEFVTIQNPNPVPVLTRLDYFVQDQGVVTKTRQVAASSRATVAVFDPTVEGAIGVVAGTPLDTGLRVTSIGSDGRPDATAPIVVERPIYVNAAIADSQEALNGGHNTLGYEFPAGEVPLLPDEAVLTVDKTGPAGPVEINQEATYTITAAHAEGATATGVTITDTLPADAVFVRSSGSPSVSGQTLTWTEGDLDPGESASETYVVRYPGPGSKLNTAAARSTNGGAAFDRFTTEVLGFGAATVTLMPDCGPATTEPPRLSITVLGEGFLPDVDARITFDVAGSREDFSVITNSKGDFSSAINPLRRPPGTYVVRVDDLRRHAATTVFVVPCPAPGDPPS